MEEGPDGCGAVTRVTDDDSGVRCQTPAMSYQRQPTVLIQNSKVQPIVSNDASDDLPNVMVLEAPALIADEAVDIDEEALARAIAEVTSHP